MRSIRPSLTILTLAATATVIHASDDVTTGILAPDLIVSDLPMIQIWGQSDGEVAMSIGMTACNIGNGAAIWDAQPSNQHPLFAQNLYRLAGERLEQIGQSWVRHGICSVDTPICGTCQGTPDCSLGAGCASPSSANANGQQNNLGPKFQVDALTGNFPVPWAQGEGVTGLLSRRLRVQVADLELPTAQYFAEGQLVHPEDSAAGNQFNNVSYRPYDVTPTGAKAVGPVVPQRAGPEIWQDHVPGVDVLDLLDFFGGQFKIGQRAWENPPGLWNYEYAVYNMNSAVGAGAFEILLPPGITLTQIGFHDVDYHSGDGLDDQSVNGADWIPQILPTPRGDLLRWETDFGDPNANALRWGTMYNFRFQSDLPPQPVPGGLEQFGAPGFIPIELIGPGGGIVGGTLLGPKDGIEFNQVDYGYDLAPFPDSNHGFVTIEFALIEAAVGAPDGYINITTDQGWVVRNMPVLSEWDKPGMGTMFNLFPPGPSLDVGVLTANVLHTPDPLIEFFEPPIIDFPVGALTIDAEGRNAPILTAPTVFLPWPDVLYNPIGLFLRLLQGNHPSVEQDDNQCGPGAIANSFEWLKREYGLPIPDANIPGVEGDPPNSRVGKLDDLMGRMQGETVGDGQAMMGKLKYIAQAGLNNRLKVKHYNRAGTNFLDGDQTEDGVTSEDQSGDADSIADWIKQEIEDGEDVELAIPGHWVEVAAAGEIGGCCWIAFVHDADQGYDDKEEATDENGGNTFRDGGVVWTPLKNNKMTGFQNADLDLAFSQSPDCKADFDGNGEIGFTDLVQVLSEWGPCTKGEECPQDLTGDGNVGFTDLVKLLSQWGDCPD